MNKKSLKLSIGIGIVIMISIPNILVNMVIALILIYLLYKL